MAQRLLVLGGECNYLMRCELTSSSSSGSSGSSGSGSGGSCGSGSTARLVAVPEEQWHAPTCSGPKPLHWDKEEISRMLDIAESTMNEAVVELRLRAKILRKPRSCGMIPGGVGMIEKVPVGHV